MANAITRFVNNIQTNRRLKRANQIIEDIDTVAREGINRQITNNIPATIPSRDVAISNQNTIVTGKINKAFAPNRQLQYGGVYINRFNMSDIYASYIGENLIKFAVDKYTEAVVRNGWQINSKNPTIVRYIKKRIREMEFNVKSSFEEFINDFTLSLILYGNVYAVKHKQLGVSSGGEYINHMGKRMKPIVSLYVEDPRKLIIGEGPAGRMRYVRLGVETNYIDINKVNPSLFTDPMSMAVNRTLYSSPNGFYGIAYNMLRHVGMGFSGIFKVNPKRIKPYLIYEDDQIDHIRYHHVPGEKIAMPPFWSTLNDIDSLRRIEENIELLAFQHGHPLLHGKIGDETKPGSHEEVEELRAKLQNMESNGFIVTDNRTLIDMIGAEGKALRFDGYMKYFYNRVLTGLWLSEVAVGQGNTTNRSTANVLDKLSQEKVVELQRIFSNFFNSIMIQWLQEAGAELSWIMREDNVPTFHFKEIDLEGKIRKEQHILTMWQSNMITEDEMRMELGYEPFTNADYVRSFVKRVSIPLKKAGTAPKVSSSGDGSSGGSSAANKVTQTGLKPKNQNGTAGPRKGINKG